LNDVNLTTFISGGIFVTYNVLRSERFSIYHSVIG